MRKSLSFGELADKCLKAKAKDSKRAHKRIREERYARMYTDAEGAWNLHARGPVEDGARFKVVYERLVDEMFRTAKAEGRKEPVPAYAFDALIALGGPGRHTPHGAGHEGDVDTREVSGVDPGRSRRPGPR